MTLLQYLSQSSILFAFMLIFGCIVIHGSHTALFATVGLIKQQVFAVVFQMFY